MRTLIAALSLALLSGSALAASCPTGLVRDPLHRCVCPAGYLIHKDRLSGHKVCFIAPGSSGGGVNASFSGQGGKHVSGGHSDGGGDAGGGVGVTGGDSGGSGGGGPGGDGGTPGGHSGGGGGSGGGNGGDGGSGNHCGGNCGVGLGNGGGDGTGNEGNGHGPKGGPSHTDHPGHTK